jgi:Na+-transporting methylmalonyl-CoA/oxaloacetate decarboxylase gamma subunit
MDNAKWSFGLTMMIVGMGGTFLTLWILSMVMDMLKKVFPLVAKIQSSETTEKN